MKLDRYLNPHFRFYMREVRTVVYTQFLESYKSVTIESMASTFGVSVDFIDHELSSFVAAGKLHCKMDKVAGVLETNRPDAKNALYQSTIKQEDFLLNRILKLSRVIRHLRHSFFDHNNILSYEITNRQSISKQKLFLHLHLLQTRNFKHLKKEIMWLS